MALRTLPRVRRLSQGFTLVELVTVIVILGVLAAVALPRFTDLQGKAREAKVKATTGAVRTAASLAKAGALAAGTSCAANGTLTMEGTSVALNHCYPQALGDFATGVLAASNVLASDGWAISTTTGETGGATAGSTVVVHLTGSATPANCSISYTSASAADGAPTITQTVSGC